MNEKNKIRQSLDKIQAAEDLKKNTLQYLLTTQEKRTPSGSTQASPRFRLPSQRRPGFKYALAALCMFLLLGIGGYSVYRQPVSYISIDVNPSVELGINRFGRVVSADAYNNDGDAVLQQLSLKNIPYIQAIDKLLANESDSGFLNEDSLLVFTVVSAQNTSILEELSAAAFFQNYETRMYTCNTICMEEAHSHEMSFGKYRGYQELSKYDASVTLEDCHNMTMEEIHSRIESCSGHQGETGSQHHGAPSAGSGASNPAGTGTPEPIQTGAPPPAGGGHHKNCGKNHR